MKTKQKYMFKASEKELSGGKVCVWSKFVLIRTGLGRLSIAASLSNTSVFIMGTIRLYSDST